MNGPYFIPIYLTYNEIVYFYWTFHYSKFFYKYYVKRIQSSLYYAARRFLNGLNDPRVFETQWTIVYINLEHSKGLLSEENEALSSLSSF